jgi:hypothetical protein
MTRSGHWQSDFVVQVAQNILACAATGERDPIELGHAALANVRGA